MRAIDAIDQLQGWYTNAGEADLRAHVESLAFWPGVRDRAEEYCQDLLAIKITAVPLPQATRFQVLAVTVQMIEVDLGSRPGGVINRLRQCGVGDFDGLRRPGQRDRGRHRLVRVSGRDQRSTGLALGTAERKQFGTGGGGDLCMRSGGHRQPEDL